MKRLSIFALLVLAAPLWLHGQNCNAIIYDNLGLFTANQAQILAAADKLVKLGADPHVVAAEPTIPAEQYERQIELQCPSWQSASGGRKNNLIVLMVFPKQRKVGFYMGGAYAGYLRGDVVRTQYMAPAFRDGDWTRGMVQGLNQAAIEIHMHQDPPPPPATDFSGLWRVLGWVVALAAGAGLFWLGVVLFEMFEAVRSAQQKALLIRDEVPKRLAVIRDKLATQNALGKDVASLQAGYDRVVEQFSRLSGSERTNPDTKRLSKGQYEAMIEEYRELLADCSSLAASLEIPSQWRRSKRTHHGTPPTAADHPTASATPLPVTTQSISTVVVDVQSGYYQPTPVFVEPVPVFVPEPVSSLEWSSERTSSDRSYDGGGASSSFGSDSSDSSFSDSGGSSDFGSDGGGGGSSDF